MTVKTSDNSLVMLPAVEVETSRLGRMALPTEQGRADTGDGYNSFLMRSMTAGTMKIASIQIMRTRQLEATGNPQMAFAAQLCFRSMQRTSFCVHTIAPQLMQVVAIPATDPSCRGMNRLQCFPTGLRMAGEALAAMGRKMPLCRCRRGDLTKAFSPLHRMAIKTIRSHWRLSLGSGIIDHATGCILNDFMTGTARATELASLISRPSSGCRIRPILATGNPADTGEQNEYQDQHRRKAESL